MDDGEAEKGGVGRENGFGDEGFDAGVGDWILRRRRERREEITVAGMAIEGRTGRLGQREKR